jgi:protein-S-isoprenylcysteine O-methyltransferase Ste14
MSGPAERMIGAGQRVASHSGWEPVRRQVPRVLFVVALTLLGLALVIRLTRADQPPEILAAVLTAAYLLWIAAEAPVTFGRTPSASAESRTLVVYAVARVGTAVSAALGHLPWSRYSAWMVLPVLAFAAGIALRSAAIVTLGRFYSHFVARDPGHVVVTSGPYRLVRHPAYAGMLLANAGFVAFFANPVSVAFAVALTAAIVWRIHVEERVLWPVSGYRQYAQRHARLLRGVW